VSNPCRFVTRDPSSKFNRSSECTYPFSVVFLVPFPSATLDLPGEALMLLTNMVHLLPHSPSPRVENSVACPLCSPVHSCRALPAKYPVGSSPHHLVPFRYTPVSPLSTSICAGGGVCHIGPLDYSVHRPAPCFTVSTPDLPFFVHAADLPAAWRRDLLILPRSQSMSLPQQLNLNFPSPPRPVFFPSCQSRPRFDFPKRALPPYRWSRRL